MSQGLKSFFSLNCGNQFKLVKERIQMKEKEIKMLSYWFPYVYKTFCAPYEIIGFWMKEKTPKATWKKL